MTSVYAQIAVSEVSNKIETLLATQFSGIPQLPLKDVDLGEQARLIDSTLRPMLIKEHPLHDIMVAAIRAMIVHAEAVDALKGSQAIAVHIRQIEEHTAWVEYLVGQRDCYNEFSWRWREFQVVHAIRNRIFSLRQPLDLAMHKWIGENLSWLQKVNKKFTGDPVKDEGLWKRYNNWLFPLNIRDVFASTGRATSYDFNWYEWSSHCLHFSPLGEQYYGFELSDGLTFEQALRETAERNIDSLARLLLPMVKDWDRLRSFHAAIVLRDFYLMQKTNAVRAQHLVESSELYQVLVTELIKENPEFTRLLAILLGKEPDDPLVIRI